MSFPFGPNTLTLSDLVLRFINNTQVMLPSWGS